MRMSGTEATLMTKRCVHGTNPPELCKYWYCQLGVEKRTVRPEAATGKRKLSTEFSRAQLIAMLATHRGFLMEVVRVGKRGDVPEIKKLLEETNMDVDESDLIDGAFDMSWSEEG